MTIGTVAIAAGIGMKLKIVTFITPTDVKTKGTGFAVHDAIGCFSLFL